MQVLSDLYHSHFGVFPDSVLPITGSASNRRYFRLVSAAGSAIGVAGVDARENRAFVSMARHFRSKGINVPEIYSVSGDWMYYLQQDLGDESLSSRVGLALSNRWMSDPVLEEILCRTMEDLVKIQFEGADGLDFSVCWPHGSFDRRSVMFDLNYFKYCFLKPSGLEFDEVMLQDDFDRFADDLLEDDVEGFLYRDFNARNVMLVGDEPYFIDFQGGRRGPIYYDIASFVWQARAQYPDDLKQRMVDSYFFALSGHADVDRGHFDARLEIFVLFRLLQVLGAYGFRGWMEHKAAFVVSIPPAIDYLRRIAECGFDRYPYLTQTLRRLVELPRFADRLSFDGRLEVRVQSFSYKKGIPEDPSGNGGGYVFDCRSIHNPGRYEPYRKLTGRDEEVIRFLEDDGEILTFLEHVYGVVDPHVETYSRRGFTSLMVSFGCTGGQHRSVYCAEHLARHIAAGCPAVRVRLIHREQNIEEILNP